MGKKKKQVDVSMFGTPSLAPPPEVEMKPSARAVPVPQQYNTLADEDAMKERDEQQKADLSWGELPGKVLQDSWMVPAAQRFIERNEYVPPEDGYKVPQEELDKLPYKMEDLNYLKTSTSPEDFQRKRTYLDEDLTRKQGLAAYGWQGATASFIGALFDPVQWGIAAVTGPEAYLARGGKAIKAAKGAIAFGTQGAVAEGILAGGDTQKSVNDVLHGFAFGAVLGGGLGAMGRKHPNVAASDSADLAVRREAGLLREADLSHTGDISAELDRPTFLRQREGVPASSVAEPVATSPEFRAKGLDTPTFQRGPTVAGEDAVMPAEAALHEPVDATHPVFKKVTEDHTGVDAAEVGRAVEQHVADLEAKGQMEFRGRKGAATRKALEEAQAQTSNDVKELRDMMNTHRAEIVAERGAPSNADEHTLLEALIQKVEENYRPALTRAEQKLADLTDRLKAGKEARNSRKLLEEFKAKTPEEQMAHLFPEGPPKFREHIERHEFVADEVGKEVDAAETTAATKHLDTLDPMAEAGEMYDIITGKPVNMKTEPKASSTTEAVPSHANKVAAQAKAEERAAKVEELRVKSTTGQSTPDFVRSLIERAKQKGSTTLQWLPFQWMRDRIQGVYTTLDHSSNQAFRGLNDLLHETAQGQLEQGHTASAFQHLFLNQIRSAEKNRYNVGFLSWAKEEGIPTVKALLDIGGRKAEFNTEVYLKVIDPSREVSAGVAMAAEGHRDAMSLALQLRQRAGELGWENIQDSRAYMPVIFESTAVVHLSAKYGENKVLKMISKSYQEGKFRLKPGSADKLAEMQIRRSRSHQLSGSQVFKNVVSESERAAFIADLKKSGVPEEHIMSFLEDQETAQLLDNISNRAKFSLGLNPLTEHEGMRMVDLLYTDTPMLTQNYYRESAGGAALAKMGFRSYEHANRVVNMAEEVGLRAGAEAARNKEEAAMFRDTLKLMYGKSIDANPHGALEITSRRLRGVAATRSLGLMGFAQFPETARAITHLGLTTVLKNVPAVAIFRRKAARVGGTSAGELSDPVMRSIERVLGYVGEDSWLAPLHIRGDEPLVRETSDQIARVLDNTLAVGGNVNNVASGFQFTQGGLEKIVMRSISEKVLGMAEGKMPFPERTASEVGWNKQFLSDLQDFVRNNPKSEHFNGENISVINFEKMPPEMMDTLLIGMQRIKGRLVQQNFIGDSSTWMNGSLGKVLTQFKSFSIISVEKQLIHDLRGDKIAAAQTLMWSALLGYMAYNARTYVSSIGRGDRSDYLDKHLNSRATALGTFNMMPQVAGLSLGGDFLGTVGLLPDSMISAPGRDGVHPMSGANIAPAAGVIADSVKLAHSAVRMMDPNSPGTRADVAKAARRLVPLSNALGIGQILNAGQAAIE